MSLESRSITRLKVAGIISAAGIALMARGAYDQNRAIHNVEKVSGTETTHAVTAARNTGTDKQFVGGLITLAGIVLVVGEGQKISQEY